MLHTILILLSTSLCWGQIINAAHDQEQQTDDDTSRSEQLASTSPHAITMLPSSHQKHLKKDDDSSDEESLAHRDHDLEAALLPSHIDCYVNSITLNTKEWKQVIVTLLAAVKAQRATTRDTSVRAVHHVDPIAHVIQRIDTHFGKSMFDMREMASASTPPSPIQSQAKEDLSTLISRLATQTLEKEGHALDPGDTDAITDVAQIIGSFMHAQATQGIPAKPADLMKFLAQIDFVAAAPVVARLLGKCFKCNQRTITITTCILTAIGFFILVALNVGPSVYAWLGPTTSDASQTNTTNMRLAFTGDLD